MTMVDSWVFVSHPFSLSVLARRWVWLSSGAYAVVLMQRNSIVLLKCHSSNLSGKGALRACAEVDLQYKIFWFWCDHCNGFYAGK
jgi:hypothetical protein